MNTNCYHLHGPHGVKLVTQRIKDVLATQQPKYMIRADIKSYYKSIRYHILLQDIKRHYSDPNVQVVSDGSSVLDKTGIIGLVFGGLLGC